MAGYEITEVRPLVDIDAAGRFVKIYRVYFKYAGIEDYIDVKEDEYTEENVRKKIEERIAVHSKLLGK